MIIKWLVYVAQLVEREPARNVELVEESLNQFRTVFYTSHISSPEVEPRP
jgi:hypothetical protein